MISTCARRIRAAWAVLRGGPCPYCPTGHGQSAVSTTARPSTAGLMALSVGLVAESSRTRPDTGTLNSLLADVAPADLPHVVAAVAILGATLGRELALHDATGPAELLRHIGLVAARAEVA